MPLSHNHYTPWQSQSPLNSIWFNSTRHALVHTHLPVRSHETFAPARPLGRGTRHKLWTGSQRHGKRPIEGRLLYTKTVDRKTERDRLLHWWLVWGCHRCSPELHFVIVTVCGCNGLDNEKVKVDWNGRRQEVMWFGLCGLRIALIETLQMQGMQ